MYSLKCKALSLALAALLALGCSVTAFAETLETNTADTAVTAADELIAVFDEETGMYRYSFENGSEFWTSEALSATGIITSAFWIDSEAPDIGINITRGGEPIDVSEIPVLSEAGNYVIEIIHTPTEGDRAVYVYEVMISPAEEVVSGDTTSSIRGRLEVVRDGDGYYYSFGDAGGVRTNVLDGETVSTPAKLLVDDALYCSVRRDGSVYSLPQNGVISEDGAYSVIIAATHSDGTQETREFAFNVYTGATNRLGIYHPPFGYSIGNVLFEGEEYPFTDDCCYLAEDGKYAVTYSDGAAVITVVLERDTTAPVLYFNGGSDTVFASDVTVTADSPCTITVQKNGLVQDNCSVLSENGIYRVTATDRAGNTVSVRIEIYEASMAEPLAVAVILAGGTIAAVIYYIVQKNKRPVVR